jgi:alcohol dehydrogenase class IV
MDFSFSTSEKIIFGSGKLSQLPEIIGQYGQNALIILGKKYPDPKLLFSLCENSKIKWDCFHVSGEPKIETIDKAVQLGRKIKNDFVISFGGGSVIDTGKAAAALLNNKGSLLDYLEVVGAGNPLKNPSQPHIAIPTTAGTGSEVTKNAVISVPKKKVKVSMRNSFLIPVVTIIDPDLTIGLPRELTASTGMDAFVQVIEPYVSRNSNALVDVFCKEAIPKAAAFLPRAWENGDDRIARENMSFVSLLGGLSLANAKLGAVHGFAGPIGGMFDAPHGLICATLLPSVMQVNTAAISENREFEKIKSRYQDISKWVTGNEKASISDGVKWLASLCKQLDIPRLSTFGIIEKDFPRIIEKAKRSSSMKGNPITLKEKDLFRILELST